MASVYALCGAFHFIPQGRPPLSRLFEEFFSGLFYAFTHPLTTNHTQLPCVTCLDWAALACWGKLKNSHVRTGKKKKKLNQSKKVWLKISGIMWRNLLKSLSVWDRIGLWHVETACSTLQLCFKRPRWAFEIFLNLWHFVRFLFPQGERGLRASGGAGTPHGFTRRGGYLLWKLQNHPGLEICKGLAPNCLSSCVSRGAPLLCPCVLAWLCGFCQIPDGPIMRCHRSKQQACSY